MADDRRLEDKVKTEEKTKPDSLTEETEPGANPDGAVERESSPPQVSSPFKAIADPKSPDELVDDRDIPQPTGVRKSAFTPKTKGSPVVATPIQRVVSREQKRDSRHPRKERRSAFEDLDSSFADEWKAVLNEDEPIVDLSTDMMVKKDDEPFPFQKEVLKRESQKGATPQAAEGSPELAEAAADESDDDVLDLAEFDDEKPFELTAEEDLEPHLHDDGSEAEVDAAKAEPPEEGPVEEAAAPEGGEADEAVEVDAGQAEEEIPVVPEDEVTEEVPAKTAESEAAEEEIPVVEDDLAEEITEVDAEAQASAETAEDDEGEEIDLSEAEEMPAAPPKPPPSTAKEGRKPRIRRRKKHSTEWWARIFNDDYVSTIPKATVRGDQRKVNFIEKNLALPPNSLVLDLACGNGRHSVGMAKRGYRVVGIDLSLPMLAQAAELAQDENQNINFIHGDMRDLSFDRTFDGIFCMGTSFGYFDEEYNLRVLEGVVRSLKSGGSFLLEVANRDHVITQTPDLTWFEGNGSVCMEETQFDFSTSRLAVKRQLIMDGGRQVQNEISVRLYSLHELTDMFRQAGLTITSVSGHGATQGAFFGKDSVRIMMAAKRSQ
jgi:SAM-dependent methyltransferase